MTLFPTSFDPRRGYTGVVMQRGRVSLDPDAVSPAGSLARRIMMSFGGSMVMAPASPSLSYVSVRRLAMYIEQSLQGNLQWVVFQPNGPALWARRVSTVESYLNSLLAQGALQGSSPSQAYFVRCDATTMTPTDIAAGVVKLMVGFAPQYPAEFVILVIGLTAAPGKG